MCCVLRFPADPATGTMSLDLSLEFADPYHTALLLAYIVRRRTREQVKVGGVCRQGRCTRVC
jgi:hypothetical protein